MALRIILAVAALLATGCGGSPPSKDAGSSPDSGADAGADGGTDAGARPSCSAWTASETGAGVPAAVEPAAITERGVLRAAGGGVTPVGTKYFASYFPAGFQTNAAKRVLVSLHGTAGAPEVQLMDYRADLDARGWGFLGLKYYDDQTQTYDSDETIYANLKEVIAYAKTHCELSTAKFYLTGFSRGSAKSFAMAYLDRLDAKLFSAFGSHSGGAWPQPSGCAWTKGGACAWQPTNPLYPASCAQIAPGAACSCSPLTAGAPATPAKPPFVTTILNANDLGAYSNARFWLYCGEGDYTGGFRNCDQMELSKLFVETHGGHVEELYVAGAADGCPRWTGTTCIRTPDLACGHGSWKSIAAARSRMWTYFESL